MDTPTRILLANVAGSMLLLVAFLLLAVATVALYMVWRGLGAARPELRRLVREGERVARQADLAAQQTIDAVIAPQIRIASAWVGLKAGARALLGRRSDRVDQMAVRDEPPVSPSPP